MIAGNIPLFITLQTRTLSIINYRKRYASIIWGILLIIFNHSLSRTMSFINKYLSKVIGTTNFASLINIM